MSFVNQNVKPLNTKRNEAGNLEISGCDLSELAKKYSTPLYVMDEVTLRKMALDYKEAFSIYKNTRMMYASKALMTTAIASIFYNLGFGFDVVSLGEMYILKNAGVDFSHATLSECDFSGSLLNGATFSYSNVNYCNFSDSDLAGTNFSEAELSDSDFSTSENLGSCRFDESTVWPEGDKLPEDFDCTYNYDLSSLREEDDENNQEVY